jgi:RecA-family ATPase
MMDAAIDYAEAARNARDLAKLAKLASEPIVKTNKEAGKPREEVITTQEKEGTLGSAKEYAERSYQEVLGASVALDAAIKFMR